MLEGLHKSRYWEPVLEDSLDLIARLPALAARIYRRTYHGGKYIDAKVSFSFFKKFFFSLSLSLDDIFSLTLFFLLYSSPTNSTNQTISLAWTGPETSRT